MVHTKLDDLPFVVLQSFNFDPYPLSSHDGLRPQALDGKKIHGTRTTGWELGGTPMTKRTPPFHHYMNHLTTDINHVSFNSGNRASSPRFRDVCRLTFDPAHVRLSWRYAEVILYQVQRIVAKPIIIISPPISTWLPAIAPNIGMA